MSGLVICYFCQGQRWVRVVGTLRPCEECGGTGELHCCEGLQAQPEPEDFAQTSGTEGVPPSTLARALSFPGS